MTPAPPEPYRLLWITPEVQGGIASYSHMLWPAVAEAAKAAGDFAPLQLLQTAPVARADAISVARDLQPDLVHVQHEHGRGLSTSSSAPMPWPHMATCGLPSTSTSG
jgi:hypothetical protein